MTQIHHVRGQIAPVFVSALLPNGREWGVSAGRSPVSHQRGEGRSLM